MTAAAPASLSCADDPTTDESGRADKKQVLAWFDDYAEKQVLFHDDDIARLRKELADDTPEEAAKWWSKTTKIRASLDSKQWSDTREWLREFLKVQAIYSDEQIAEFQKEAKEAVKKESPKAFEEILADVESRRSNLRQASASDADLRKQKLSVVQAFHKEEAASRMEADRARAAARPATSAKQPVQPRAPRYSRPPLVNSLDAARWGIMRGFLR
jgi:hypothetical protein